MIRNVFFQLHWFLGITAGTVLAIMGLTGASIAFEDEMLRALNPRMANVAVQHEAGAHALPLDELVSRLQGGARGKSVERLQVDATGRHPSEARFGNGGGGRGRGGRTVYFDPFTGAVIGEPKGQATFDFLENVHRRLAAGETGKAITGACVLTLLFFVLSGLYLRWPRRWRSPRAWLAVEWKRSGRSFLWSLHSVIGTWVLLVYLVIALTGLWWSYGWYRTGVNALLGAVDTGRPPAAGVQKKAPPLDIHRLRLSLDAAAPEARDGYMDIRMGGDGVVNVRYRGEVAAHDRAYNVLAFDITTGEVKRAERYEDMPAGRQLLSSIYALHTGSFFGTPGRVVNMVSAACMSLFFVTGWMLYLDRRRKKREARASRLELPAAVGDPWRVFYASQSGTAERLAWHAAGQLQGGGVAVEVHPIARLDHAMLADTRRALFVVSTFGDGEPPDAARSFERRVLALRPSLGHLNYAMLGLGDSQYAAFCGFSRRVQAWMDQHGAVPLFAPVELDRADEDGLGRWNVALASATGVATVVPVMEEPAFAAWTLRGRRHLNPSSVSAGMYMVTLDAPAGVNWRAGDIIEVATGHADDVSVPVREYSIASVATDGTAELMVRLVTRDDGSHGVGSGWLCVAAGEGTAVRARVRSNPAFHRLDGTAPMILIGSGTGMAGLRSLIREAAADCHHGHWLVYGERTREHDHAFAHEIESWVDAGVLARADTVFSRDQPGAVYVQHRLADEQDALRDWVARGASIYVCGSRVGMGADVDMELRRILGTDAVDALAESGRYRRDVY